MMPEVFWIPGPWAGRLAISTRPRGGDWLEDEMRTWHSAGVDVVVSLLDSVEESDLELGAEGRLARLQSIRHISFPVVDRSVPSSVSDTIALLTDLRKELEAGKNVAVHCRQGVGRSAIIAAGVLIAAGEDPQKALHIVGSARGLLVPETPEQRLWIEKVLADRLALARR